MSAPPSKKSKKATPAALPGTDDRRSRRLVNKPRMRSVIDPETRRQVAAARLAALEQDNWIDAAESTGRGTDGAYEDEADEEIEQGGTGGAKRKRKTFPRSSTGAGATAASASSAAAASASGVLGVGGKSDRAAKVSSGLLAKSTLRNLDHVVAEAGYDSDPETAPEPNYKTIAAGPSARPPRWFCSVCGFLAPYTCPRCGLRFCTLRCQHTHKETRCLKFAE